MSNRKQLILAEFRRLTALISRGPIDGRKPYLRLAAWFCAFTVCYAELLLRRDA